MNARGRLLAVVVVAVIVVGALVVWRWRTDSSQLPVSTCKSDFLWKPFDEHDVVDGLDLGEAQPGERLLTLNGWDAGSYIDFEIVDKTSPKTNITGDFEITAGRYRVRDAIDFTVRNRWASGPPRERNVLRYTVIGTQAWSQEVGASRSYCDLSAAEQRQIEPPYAAIGQSGAVLPVAGTSEQSPLGLMAQVGLYPGMSLRVTGDPVTTEENGETFTTHELVILFPGELRWTATVDQQNRLRRSEVVQVATGDIEKRVTMDPSPRGARIDDPSGEPALADR